MLPPRLGLGHECLGLISVSSSEDLGLASPRLKLLMPRSHLGLETECLGLDKEDLIHIPAVMWQFNVCH